MSALHRCEIQFKSTLYIPPDKMLENVIRRGEKGDRDEL